MANLIHTMETINIKEMKKNNNLNYNLNIFIEKNVRYLYVFIILIDKCIKYLLRQFFLKI